MIIEEPKKEEINPEITEKTENVKLRGKKKNKDENKIINIPDIIDLDKEDKNIEQIREVNKESEEEEGKTAKGKCGCFIY